MNCDCGCRTATAHPLTAPDAERIKAGMIAELRSQVTSLLREETEGIVVKSILAKRPSLFARCDGCRREWFE